MLGRLKKNAYEFAGFRTLCTILSVALTFGLAVAASAQDLDQIITNGKMSVGIQVDNMPFGFVDSSQNLQGYDVEVATLMGKYLGVQIDLVPLNGSNRIPYLVSGKVDALVATLGITPQRARQVAFSIPYGAIEEAVLAPRTRKIASPSDLSGLTIGVMRGSTDDTLITALAPQDAKVLRFDDSPSTVQALVSGQVDAVGDSTYTLKNVYKAFANLDIEAKFRLSQQPNGIAVRREERELLRWINTYIYYIKNNGELDAISRKWIGEPLPNLPVF